MKISLLISSFSSVLSYVITVKKIKQIRELLISLQKYNNFNCLCDRNGSAIITIITILMISTLFSIEYITHSLYLSDANDLFFKDLFRNPIKEYYNIFNELNTHSRWRRICMASPDRSFGGHFRRASMGRQPRPGRDKTRRSIDPIRSVATDAGAA